MGYLRKPLTPKGDCSLGYFSISNHAAPQKLFSRPKKIQCHCPCRPPLYTKRFLFQTRFNLGQNVYRNIYDSTTGLDPTRTIKDCRTFGAHLELLLLHSCHFSFLSCLSKHSIMRFTSFSNFRVFSIYKERRPWNLAVNQSWLVSLQQYNVNFQHKENLWVLFSFDLPNLKSGNTRANGPSMEKMAI